MRATAIAHANIALVKYWGKRDDALNLPAKGSLSLTLSDLTTRATVQFDALLPTDQLSINGALASPAATHRVSTWLDLVRLAGGISQRANITTESNFPTASGLASSASAFAALAVAAASAANLSMQPRELSILARRGSGSAARSIFPGLVRMHAGSMASGTDSFAEPIAHPWSEPTSPLRMVVAIVGGGLAKANSSRSAMQHCNDTSPLHQAWLNSVDGDLRTAESAIATGDFAGLGQVAEASALAMHASMMAARPPVLYFRPETLSIMQKIRELQSAGVQAYFTMDAGPHVKVLTLDEHAAAVVDALTSLTAVSEVRTSRVGGAATLETP